MALASAAESGSPPRAWPLVVIGGWSAMLFLAGLTVVGAFGFYAGSYYWFTIPFLAASGLCAAAAAAGACWRVLARPARARLPDRRAAPRAADPAVGARHGQVAGR